MTYKIYFLNIPLFYVGLQVIWFGNSLKCEKRPRIEPERFEKGWGMSLPRLGHRLKNQHLAKRNPVRLDDILAIAQAHLAFCLFYENVVDR